MLGGKVRITCVRVLGSLVILAVIFSGAPSLVASSQGESNVKEGPQDIASESATELPQDVSVDWWAAAQVDILKSEYNITWQEQTYLQDIPAAYQAPNRANNLRTYFMPEKTVVIPRIWNEEGDVLPWRWGIELEAWSMESNLTILPAAQIEVQENQVAYRRSDLTEVYLNDENGLKQTFLIANAGTRSANGKPSLMILRLTLSGNLTPVAQDSQAIEFMAEDGSVALRYGMLEAQDAEGNRLPVDLALSARTLEIIVDDTTAIYPIQVSSSINGLPTSWDWKVEGGFSDTEFGYALSTAGDVNRDGYSDVIIGAPKFDDGQTNEGRALLFLGSPTGLSTSPSWTTESNQTEARYGTSVSTASDVNGDGYSDVIIGAPGYDNGQVDEGRAWVYHGIIGSVGLASTAARQLESNQAGAQMGFSVAFAGNVNGDDYADILIGAPFFTSGQSNEGVVWLFHGSDNGIPAGSAWVAQSNQVNAHFGWSVDTAGDINGDGYADVIVGAPDYDNDQIDEGKAFVWHGSSNGINNAIYGDPTNAAWSREINQAGAFFGLSVSTAGDVNGDGFSDVIIGAPYYTNGQNLEGGSWVYHGSSTGLSTSSATHDEGNQDQARFGTSVGLAGDVNGDGYADVIVGAPGYDNGQVDEGRAWVWHGSPNGLSELNDWNAEGNQTNANFGGAVATAGDVNGDGYSDVIVGASGYHNPNTDEGAAFVYNGSPAALGEDPGWTKRSNLQDAYFGWSVGTAGDVNGDGYADIIVGAYRWDGGTSGEGGAWVYHGSATGPVSAPAWYKHSSQEYSQFGYSVATAGDVNGDGYSDVIVGANLWNDGQDDEGGAWIYLGSSSGVSTTPFWYKQSDHTGAEFGTSVASAGDVNGDGYADVIVGAPLYNHPTTDEGLAFVYHGGATKVNTVPDWYGQGDFADAQYGYSVASAGDVNADGYSDVIVGSPYWSDDVRNEGRAWVYLGSSAGLVSSHAWHAESNNLDARMGWSVASAGDVNGDGYSDVIVGAPYYGDGGLTSEGKVWVFHGSISGLNTSAAWTKESGQNGAYYGYSVATAGDVNGDGFADIILGAPLYTATTTNEGVTRVYLGSQSGLLSTFSWKGEGGQVVAWYGNSVSTAGDVNGDGYADVIVGAKDYNEVYINEGKVFLYYGNASKGLSIRPLQARFNSSVPIAPLGKSDSLTGLRFYTSMWSPFGRIGLQQEVEYKPLGEVFNGSSTMWWGFFDDPAPGAIRYIPINNLSPCTPYHWRIRLVYNPETTPYMPASRWLTMPWNGWNEADFRADGECIFLPLLEK